MEETSQYIAEGELSSPNKPVKKKPKWWVIVIDAVVVATFLLAIAASAGVIYFSTAYDKPFFVNGMSMYPTLNCNAISSKGTRLYWRSGENSVGDTVEYGYAKTNYGTLKRNDIVLTYYDSDYRHNADGSLMRDAEGKLILDTTGYRTPKTKIKRIVGLPGETVQFVSVTEDTEFYNRAWGKTTINPGTPEEQILKPLYTMADYVSPTGEDYDYPKRSFAPCTLGEKQYYVIGDNRNPDFSSDSRINGPILEEMIVAKACIIVGMRKLTGQAATANPWEFIFTPWNFRSIE